MGELVTGTENGTMGLEIREVEAAKPADGGAAAETAAADISGEVRWERFLPNMAVRVLLVEADDSTRQIIGALLRKCSYKVASVSDGLKAWEVLKGRPHNIDLILTEVELPSISGFALLTLIMEHDICKNIPVIMMSTHDSVSTVYNCMLRGAADFLVKPLRKNELRNLWQHVWRRQASSASGPGPPDENLAQQKIEATAENNGVSNHSSGYMACIRRNRECIERGSDAQSSCTKPEMETEGADIEHVHSLSLSKTDKCFSDDKNICSQEEHHQEIRNTRAHDNQTGDNVLVANYITSQRSDKNSDAEQVNKVNCQNFESDNFQEKKSSKVAIDLIGAFDNNCLKGTLQSPASNASTNKFDIFPPLDLSLRRSHPCSSVNQVNDETRRLNHSDASAFSRYKNKPLPPRNSTSPSTCNQTKHHETNSEKQFSNLTPDYNSDQISSRKHIQLGVPTFSYPQQREISQPIPVKGMRFENVINGFASMIPQQMYYQQSSLSPLPSPGTVSNLQYCPQFCNAFDQRISNCIDQTDKEQGRKMENLEGESGNSNFYNEHTSKESFVVHEGASHRSMQREAALNKFRQKRKDRCFDKKVRYESRKKLAEQRPRVKGQFVRQLPNSPQLGSSSTS